MGITLHRLSEQDVQKLQSLNNLFGEVFNDPKNYLNNLPSIDYLAMFLKDSSHIVVIAEERGKVIGGLVAYVLPKFEQERKQVYVYDLAVAQDIQRQGVGTQLIDEVRRIAKEEGAYVVFLQADEGDDAVFFYRSLNPTEGLATRNFDFSVEAQRLQTDQE